MSDKYNISTIYQQIEDEALIEWLKIILKKDKALRIEYLTKFVTDVEVKDIRDKYFSLCREIKKYHGVNVDGHKKLKGKKMYELYDRLLSTGLDQLAMENFKEAYEIGFAVHSFLYPLYLTDKLNETGTIVLRKTYELMNYLANVPLPPPLVSIISEDWTAILEAGNFKIFDVNYNPFTLLFKIYDDETALYHYLRDQIDKVKYSEEANKALRLIFTYAQLQELPPEKLNPLVEYMHPLQLRRILSEISDEKKFSLHKYIIDSVRPEKDKRLQQLLLKEQFNFHIRNQEYDNAWEQLILLLEGKESDEYINLLVSYLKKYNDSLSGEQEEYLRKLVSRLNKKHRREIMIQLQWNEELKEDLFQDPEVKDIIPYLGHIKKDNKSEIIKHFNTRVLDYLESYHGEKSVEYVEDILKSLQRNGHRDLYLKVIKVVADKYKNRPSIKSFLTANRI